jgi:hypothetical protein
MTRFGQLRKPPRPKDIRDTSVLCASTDRMTGLVQHFESDAEMRAFRKVERSKRGNRLSDGRRRKLYTP